MKTWSKMNKTKAVLQYFQMFVSIDTFEAFTNYRATRLSAIIYNLRYNYGLNIITEMMPFTDVYGTKSEYAKYILKENK